MVKNRKSFLYRNGRAVLCSEAILRRTQVARRPENPRWVKTRKTRGFLLYCLHLTHPVFITVSPSTHSTNASAARGETPSQLSEAIAGLRRACVYQETQLFLPLSSPAIALRGSWVSVGPSKARAKTKPPFFPGLLRGASRQGLRGSRTRRFRRGAADPGRRWRRGPPAGLESERTPPRARPAA